MIRHYHREKTENPFAITHKNDKIRHLIRQTELVETALDPKEEGEEGTSDDKCSGDWSIICDASQQPKTDKKMSDGNRNQESKRRIIWGTH